MKNIPTEQMLIEAGISHTEHGNPPEIYFSMKEVRMKFPNIKSGASLRPMPINNGLIPSVRACDLVEMTEFDKNVIQTAKFNPKK